MSLSPSLEEAVRRAYPSDFTTSDIARLLRIDSEGDVGAILDSIGKRTWVKPRLFSTSPFTYFDLSELLKVQDGGESACSFSQKDLRNPNFRRTNLREDLLFGLQTMLPDQEACFPYLLEEQLDFSKEAINYDRLPLSKITCGRIERGYETIFNAEDVSRFLHLKNAVGVRTRYRKKGKRDHVKPWVARCGKTRLSYHNISLVFEMLDLDFSPEEIADHMELDGRAVDYVLENSERLEEEIITSLQTMFPEKEITEPYLHGDTLPGNPKKPKKEAAIEWFIHAVNNGVRSIEVICKDLELTPVTLFEYCNAEGIEYPEDMEFYRYRPEVDALLEEGLSYPKVAKALGMGERTVQTYARATGQSRYVGRLPEEKKKLGDAHEKLFSLIVGKIQSHMNGDEISRLAFTEWRRPKHVKDHALSLEQYLELFTRYMTGQNGGIRHAYGTLAEMVETTPDIVRSILQRAGCAAPNEKVTYAYTPEDEALLSRAHGTEFTANDILYFSRTEVPKTVLPKILRKMGPRTHVKHRLEQKGRRILYFSLASQMYEAADLGFSVDETVELLDVPLSLVQVALEKRDNYGPRIISALQTMYPDQEVLTPYRTW